jgi:hypothetical protein
MQKKEAEKNTEKTNQLTLNLESTGKKSIESEITYNSLLGLLPKKTTKEYVKEKSIIKKILKLGFSLEDVYKSWIYYKESRDTKFDSYKIFLWQAGKLMHEALFLIKENKSNQEKDFRTTKEYVKTKKPIDYLR